MIVISMRVENKIRDAATERCKTWGRRTLQWDVESVWIDTTLKWLLLLAKKARQRRSREREIEEQRRSVSIQQTSLFFWIPEPAWHPKSTGNKSVKVPEKWAAGVFGMYVYLRRPSWLCIIICTFPCSILVSDSGIQWGMKTRKRKLTRGNMVHIWQAKDRWVRRRMQRISAGRDKGQRMQRRSADHDLHLVQRECKVLLMLEDALSIRTVEEERKEDARLIATALDFFRLIKIVSTSSSSDPTHHLGTTAWSTIALIYQPFDNLMRENCK